MAGLYKIETIQRIHRRREAVKGRIYEDVNRVKYIGTDKGFLVKEENVEGDVGGTTLDSKTSKIDGRPVSASTEKGEILVDTGSSIVPLLPGEDGTVLTADGRAPLGVSWKNVADKNFVFVQSVASSTWVVNHNLGKKPSVTVVDSGDNTVEGCEVYIDDNNLEIQFGAPFSGKAYLN